MASTKGYCNFTHLRPLLIDHIQIDILQSKIDGATLEDELSGHHRTVKFDKWFVSDDFI